MKKINKLKRYLDYNFSTGWENGKDYKQFQKEYIEYLKYICFKNKWALTKVNKNHYEFSAFIKKDNKYIFLAISDVRYFKNEWYNNITIKIANNELDYCGTVVCHTRLDKLQYTLNKIFIEI